MIIPEYIIIMTWILAAVIIAAIIAAIFFSGSARNRLEKLKEEIEVLKKEKDLWENKNE